MVVGGGGWLLLVVGGCWLWWVVVGGGGWLLVVVGVCDVDIHSDIVFKNECCLKC